MYPGAELLQEIGRVTIAGPRLEVLMGRLWWHLDITNVDELQARRSPFGTQVANVRALTAVRLSGELQTLVQEAVNAAERAAKVRNDIVHQDWVLRGRDAMRPVAALADLKSQQDLERYLEEWDREAKESPDWLRLPAHGLELVPGNTLDELTAAERRSAEAADQISALVFAVAGARETGHPAGWVTATSPDA